MQLVGTAAQASEQRLVEGPAALLVLGEAAQAPAWLGSAAASQLGWRESVQASVPKGALQPLMLVLVLVGCALQLLLLVLEGAAQTPARLWEHLLVLWKHLLVL